MKKHTLSLLLLCAIAFAFSGCTTAHHSRDLDYKVIVGGDFLERKIQAAAAEGWKVVSSGGGDQAPFVIMSRPK